VKNLTAGRRSWLHLLLSFSSSSFARQDDRGGLEVQNLTASVEHGEEVRELSTVQ